MLKIDPKWPIENHTYIGNASTSAINEDQYVCKPGLDTAAGPLARDQWLSYRDSTNCHDAGPSDQLDFRAFNSDKSPKILKISSNLVHFCQKFSANELTYGYIIAHASETN